MSLVELMGEKGNEGIRVGFLAVPLDVQSKVDRGLFGFGQGTIRYRGVLQFNGVKLNFKSGCKNNIQDTQSLRTLQTAKAFNQSVEIQGRIAGEHPNYHIFVDEAFPVPAVNRGSYELP